jgi:hypothetical protein
VKPPPQDTGGRAGEPTGSMRRTPLRLARPGALATLAALAITAGGLALESRPPARVGLRPGPIPRTRILTARGLVDLANLRPGDTLEDADLRGCDWRGVKLCGVTFAGCDLRGADLRGADLTGARFCLEFSAGWCGRRWAFSDLRGATYDGRTRWPELFDPQAYGARLVASR